MKLTHHTPYKIPVGIGSDHVSQMKRINMLTNSAKMPCIHVIIYIQVPASLALHPSPGHVCAWAMATGALMLYIVGLPMYVHIHTACEFTVARC